MMLNLATVETHWVIAYPICMLQWPSVMLTNVYVFVLDKDVLIIYCMFCIIPRYVFEIMND